MADIAEFLLARIAEDEAVARAVQGDIRAQIAIGAYRPGHEADPDDTGIVHGYSHMDDPAVIVGPARVLAECETKRHIVEIHRRIEEAYPDPKSWCCSECSASGEYPSGWPCDTLACLALAYASHDDYRQEWKPDDDLA